MTDMTLFETIRIQDGKAYHLKYHNDRLNRSRRELFGSTNTINISDCLADIPSKGLYRAKLIYGQKVEDLTYYIYKAKDIRTFSIVETDIKYDYKFLDRTEIDTLQRSVTNADEVIFAQGGLLTDSTIANIALLQNGIWYTPKKPMLLGTSRARLLKENKIHKRDIKIEDLALYEGLALMNAMIGFKIISHAELKDTRVSRCISY